MPNPTRKYPPVKITKSYVDRIVPGARDEFHWDTELKGFGVRCTPTRKLTFVVQGRPDPTRPAARITLGPYGVLTPDEARQQAREHLLALTKGTDPRAEKRQKRAASVSLREVYESYVARGTLKPTTLKWYEFYATKVFKDWLDLPVTGITRDMVRARHAQLVKEGLKGKQRKGGAPASANAAMTTLRVLLNYAADEHELENGVPLITHNPVRALKRHWAPAGDRTDWYIPFDKVGAVFNTLHDLRAIARNGGIEAGVNYVLFLMLTGRRRGEAASLRWDEVHIDRANPAASYWFLRQQKVGKPVRLPLSSAAVRVLDACKRVEGNPHVFPSRGVGGHVVDPRGVLEQVDRVAGRKVGAHGLRRTAVNLAQRELEVDRFKIKLLVGHQPDPSDVTARVYTDLSDLTFLHPLAEAVGNWIETKAAVARSANVVQLPARA